MIPNFEDYRQRIDEIMDDPELIDVSYYAFFEGALETLALLKEQGYKIGIMTNSTLHKRSRMMMQKLDMMPYIDSIVVSGEVGKQKPSVEVI